MDYNPNGQFNNQGMQQNFYIPPYYYQVPQYTPDPKEEARKKDKKILKTMGNAYGLAIIAYLGLTVILVAAFGIFSSFIPFISKIMENDICNEALNGLISVFFIGGPFFISHLFLKSKKYSGILPFGTTYNRTAAISLVMIFVPVMLFSTLAVNFISVLFQEAMGLSFESGLEDLEGKGIIGTLVLIITMSVIPAIVEEFCVRGVIMQPLRRYGDKFAIIMSALIFSMLHGNMVQIPYTFVAGLYFGYVCIATGSIWTSVALHFINNFYATLQLIIASNFGEEAGNISVVVMLGIFVVMGVVGAIIYNRLNYKTELKKGVNTLKTGEKFASVFKSPAMIVAVILLCIMTAVSIKKS